MAHNLPDILIEGHQYFRDEFYPDTADILDDLLENGQDPWALVIGCSDSRVIPELVLGAEPGEFFVLRNIANTVPKFDPEAQRLSSFWAAVEYAILHLHVPHIIVLGHDDCGGVKSFMGQDTDDEAAHAHGDSFYLHSWVQFAEDAEAMAAKFTAIEDPLARLVRANVAIQLERLTAHPAVSKAVSAGELSLIGLVYDMQGGIEYFDAESDAFLPLPKGEEHHHEH